MRALAIFVQCYALAYDVHDSSADHSSFAIRMDEMDRPLDAIRSFRAAARFAPESSAAQYNLAVALTDDSNPGAALPHMRLEARRALERALQLDPHNDDAARELGAMDEGADDEVTSRSEAQSQFRPKPKPVPVPRAKWGSPLAHVLQREQRAFVWEDAGIVAAAAGRWSLGMLARTVPLSQRWKTSANVDGRFLYGMTDESEYAPYGFNFNADAGKNQTMLNLQQFQHAVMSGRGSGDDRADLSRQSHLYLSDTLTLRSRVDALKGTEIGDTLGRLRYDRVESVWSSLGRIRETEVRHSSCCNCCWCRLFYAFMFPLPTCLTVAVVCLPFCPTQDDVAPVDRHQRLVDTCTLRQLTQRLLSSKWPQAPDTVRSGTLQCSLPFPDGPPE